MAAEPLSGRPPPIRVLPVTQLKLAVIAGDGIGTEVVAEGLKVLDAVAPSAGLTVSTTDYDLGARRYNATGETLPASVLAELRGQDAILLGRDRRPERAPGRARARRAAAAALRARPPREPAPGEALPGRGHAAGGQGPGGHRHGRLPGGHRGAVRRIRWHPAPRARPTRWRPRRA